MSILKPILPPYDPIEWRKLPFAERARAVCESWAVQGYGTPLGVFAIHGAKVGLYIWGWIFFCSFSPSLGGFSTVGSWWLEPLAFQKAIVWSMLFEVVGLGCGSGPLTGRYFPPIGGALYFLRPKTIKLPVFSKLPLLGGRQRTWFDVALYAALLAFLVRALVAPGLDPALLWPIVIVVPILALSDKTIFLAARGEHYFITILVFVVAATQTEWLAGSKGVQAALWFFAGFSKLNHHFPTVVCVMNSNSPFTRFDFFRKWMYRAYPDDLRPSRVATFTAHMGTALELAVPVVLLAAPEGPFLVVGMAMMLFLHVYITSNVPMGVPIEWNFMVVYGAYVLFWNQPHISVLDAGLAAGGIVLVASFVVPLLGNVFPERVSFLWSMRYYAGNWPMSIWLFRGDSYRKLGQNLRMTSPWVYDQLDRFYDRPTAFALVGKVMAFRLMHLHGRAIGLLLPKAIDGPLADYEWLDGEIVAGLVIGWNFGDGHLHNERLLASIQADCAFEPGELRCIFVESQPLFARTQHFRIHDAKTGLIDQGRVEVETLRQRQPWTLG